MLHLQYNRVLQLKPVVFVDAEAICEAASRPSMRFVQPRTEAQQAMRAPLVLRRLIIDDMTGLSA
ncbi:hypothetical protein CKY04_05865 [Photorhabdus sp. S8-52]|nr:hypothetical protein CKY03_05720 [Photorhabdus sp. S9-53]RAX01975.1 hypothetical protein CKY05_04960 [Photorhabdus sp. S10-54]RAX05109.1 hypothetical protein CKY04_05865 [Photorhabdus sp. S8-52]